MATGGGAAYQQLKELDNGVTQGLQFWGQLSAQQREQDKLRQEREQKRMDDLNKDFDSKYGSLEDFQNKVTGFDTYDQIGADFTSRITDKYTEEYRKAQDALKSGNLEERRNAELKMLRYKQSFKQIQDINSTLAKLNESYVKMANEGKISGVDKDNWEAQMESLIKDKNFRIDVDDNGNVELVGIQKFDDGTSTDVYNTDEKGNKKLFKIKYSEIINGNWRPYEKQDITGLTSSILKNLGSYEQNVQKGMYNIKSTLWNDDLAKSAAAQIEPLLKNKEVLADLLNQINGSTKKDNFSEEEIELVRNNLMDIVKGGYKQKYEAVFAKDYADYKLGLGNLAEKIRSNKANEATARKNADTNRMNANANIKKIENDINNGKNPNVIISPEFTVDGKTFKTFTLSDAKNSRLEPFTIGTNKKGEPINITSVDIDTKTGNFRYWDAKEKEYVEVNAKNDPNTYNTIYNQTLNRQPIQSDAGGVFNNNDPLGILGK